MNPEQIELIKNCTVWMPVAVVAIPIVLALFGLLFFLFVPDITVQLKKIEEELRQIKEKLSKAP